MLVRLNVSTRVIASYFPLQVTNCVIHDLNACCSHPRFHIIAAFFAYVLCAVMYIHTEFPLGHISIYWFVLKSFYSSLFLCQFTLSNLYFEIGIKWLISIVPDFYFNHCHSNFLCIVIKVKIILSEGMIAT